MRARVQERSGVPQRDAQTPYSSEFFSYFDPSTSKSGAFPEASSLAMGDVVLGHVGEGAGYDPLRVGVAAVDGTRERYRLVEAYVRRQGRHVRVHHRLVEDRSLISPRLLPRRSHVARMVHPYTLEPERLGEASVLEVRQALGGLVLGVALGGALLPGDEVQVAVVENEDNEARVLPTPPVLLYREHLGEAVHLHRPVPDERYGRPVGVGELAGDRVGHRGAHREECPRERALHRRLEPYVPGVPACGRPAVAGDDDVVGQLGGELPEDPLGVQGVGAVHRAGLDDLPPSLDAALDPLAPGAVGLLFEQWDEGPQGPLRVADQVHLGRVAEAQPLAVYVDLDPAGAPLPGQEVRVRHVGADHEEGVRALHQVPRGPSAQQAYGPGYPRLVIRYHGLSEECLGDPGPEEIRHLRDLLPRVQGPLADEHRHPPA